MIFAGSSLTPAVIATPGLIAPQPRSINRLVLGEALRFEVADPGVHCTLVTVIKSVTGQDPPILSRSYDRTSEEEGNIVVTFEAGLCRKYLTSGQYLFQIIKIVDTGTPPLRYEFYPEGIFEVWETAGSLEVPAEGDDPNDVESTPTSYPPTDMFLAGVAYVNQVFGFYRVPAGTALKVVRATITAQTVPSDTALIIDLIDSNGDVVVEDLTLPASQGVVEISVDEVVVPANSVLRAKIITPSGAQNVQVRLNFLL